MNIYSPINPNHYVNVRRYLEAIQSLHRRASGLSTQRVIDETPKQLGNRLGLDRPAPRSTPTPVIK